MKPHGCDSLSHYRMIGDQNPTFLSGKNQSGEMQHTLAWPVPIYHRRKE
jgi:hypothetical protein